jgi:hypothetical protein
MSRRRLLSASVFLRLLAVPLAVGSGPELRPVAANSAVTEPAAASCRAGQGPAIMKEALYPAASSLPAAPLSGGVFSGRKGGLCLLYGPRLSGSASACS